MKTEISRDSHQSKERYSGVYQQQGRMLTDSDWNELVDILKERLNEALKDVVGSRQGSIGGTPRHRALGIIVEDNSVMIQPGHIYIDGMAATLPGDAPLTFGEQLDFPAPPAPRGNYALYADVWEHTVTHLMDERLLDKGLHGADTCSRKQMLAQIKWCKDDIDPEQSDHNPSKGDAEMTLTLLQKTTDPGECDPCAAELPIDTRVGNYLFRVEVHDVQGNADGPTELTLKWSSENGAEQFLALKTQEEMPAGFISDKWVYEFFDQTSERHLGVHLNGTDWKPTRGELKAFSETTGAYPVPEILGSSETQTFVRRWDGYCKLDLTSGVLLKGRDRGVDLTTVTTEMTVNSLGYVSIGETLKIALNSLNLELELTDKSFVAGDFWLADVREAEDIEGSELIIKQPPQGIEHYYLVLGHVVKGVLQDNPEKYRKYAFPALTEMTRMFIAGGDGQEVVPGGLKRLPKPLRIAVANGEWPVEGAKVRFHTAYGSFHPIDGIVTTSPEGIAECAWYPRRRIGSSSSDSKTKYEVKVTLVDPDDSSADLAHPPVYFYANLISADQVAYTPDCQPDIVESSVHHLLLGPDDTRLGSDGYYTVKEVLDALLCELKAEHVPYNPTAQDSRWNDINEVGGRRPTTVQQAIDDLAENLESTDIIYEVKTCDEVKSPTVRSGLGLTPNAKIKVDAVLDALLCDFNATHLPLDLEDKTLCASLKADASVTTVQKALNYLCNHMGGVTCSITVGEGVNAPFDTLATAFEAFEKLGRREICICLLPGNHTIERQHVLDKASIRIVGCGAQASKIIIKEELKLRAREMQLRDLSVIGGDKEGIATSSGSLLLAGINSAHLIVENCSFKRMFRGEEDKWKPLVWVEGSIRLDWHNNEMMATRIDGKVSGAILPDKNVLDGAAWAATRTLEELFYSYPFIDALSYDEKARKVENSILSLSKVQLDAFLKARPVDASKLSEEQVDLKRINRHLSARLPMAVSPKKEVEAFFAEIEAKDKLIDRITRLASLVSSPDYALALESIAVTGSITNNQISAYIGLHYIDAERVNLIWPTKLEDEKKEKARGDYKANWAIENLTVSWEREGQLTLQGNKITALHSMVAPETLNAIEQIVDTGKTGGEVTLNAYESMSLSDNYFDEDQNSLISKFMTLNSNQFLYQYDQDGVITQAFTLGYRGIFLGNISFGFSDDGNIVIEQMLHEFYDSVKANYLWII